MKDGELLGGGLLGDVFSTGKSAPPETVVPELNLDGDSATRGEGVNHGSRYAYQKGCRCLECTQANANYRMSHYREKSHAPARRKAYRGFEKPKVFEFTDDERQFLESARYAALPHSFLETIRIKRRGWAHGFFASLPNYDRSRELADEQAIIYLPETESMRCYDPDWALVDSIAKREAANRAAAFEEFLKKSQPV